MSKLNAIFLALLLFSPDLYAFCGFFVAKTSSPLFNESSQVILARNGNKTTITMANDYEGAVKDFAMVIPVPEVLKEEQIKVVEQLIFEELAAYSNPRLAAYYDSNPCELNRMRFYSEGMMNKESVAANEVAIEDFDAEEKVKIEARYTVGEYDILILSSKESNALETWLLQNDYTIPENAMEVLEPYIKSNMKFFVVKVNLEEQKKTGIQQLRPLQINFTSKQLMLPIRLGMANAKSTQDLVIYAFSKLGSIETTNYRTVNVPSNINVPLFVEQKFDAFYRDLFITAWKKEKQNVVFKEYAWDLSSSNFQKCDPCASEPPKLQQLVNAGVDWLNPSQSQNWGSSDYDGDVYFTRLHVRYDRKHFPQDLIFQETPAKERFQARYVLTHPAQGDLSCAEGKAYKKMVYERRMKELANLASLTGWDLANYQDYAKEFQPTTVRTQNKPNKIKTKLPVDTQITKVDKKTGLDTADKTLTDTSSEKAVKGLIDSLWPPVTQQNKDEVLKPYLNKNLLWPYALGLMFILGVAIYLWVKKD